MQFIAVRLGGFNLNKRGNYDKLMKAKPDNSENIYGIQHGFISVRKTQQRTLIVLFRGRGRDLFGTRL
jgi:hypothetical protein